ncbi:MAG: YdbH domain-containing protein, partial [Paraglaciecola chathamensis]
VKRDTLLVNKLNNQLSGKISQLRKIDLTGSTRINGIALNLDEDQYLTFASLFATHAIAGDLQDKSLVSEHDLIVDEAIHMNIHQQQQTLTVSAEQQAISNFQSVVNRFMPELTLQEGMLNLNGLFELQGSTFDGKFALANGALKYNEYTAKGAVTTGHIQFNSAGLQLDKSTLHIESVNAGVPIENIEIEYVLHNSKAKINHARGDILGGTFNVSELWLDKRNQHTQVTVNDISLAKVVALQQQSGISVTGSVSGILPMSVNNNEVHIDDGLLKSEGPGTLKIDGNPAFDSIAEQQSELNYLRDLQFEQLSSNVTLNSDGLLLLDFAILGKNPNQQQAVNFNYHHEENVLTLLRSLRLTDSVQNKIEHKIKQGGVQ